MGLVTDRTIGNVGHVVCTAAYAYYVVWVLITPFVDATHPFQTLFPPREYALALPAVLLSLLVAVLLTVAAYILNSR